MLNWVTFEIRKLLLNLGTRTNTHMRMSCGHGPFMETNIDRRHLIFFDGRLDFIDTSHRICTDSYPMIIGIGGLTMCSLTGVVHRGYHTHHWGVEPVHHNPPVIRDPDYEASLRKAVYHCYSRLTASSR